MQQLLIGLGINKYLDVKSLFIFGRVIIIVSLIYKFSTDRNNMKKSQTKKKSSIQVSYLLFYININFIMCIAKLCELIVWNKRKL